MRKVAWRVIALLATAAVIVLAIARLNRKPVLAAEVKPYTTWEHYQGTSDSAQYSSLDQINKSNVSQLRQVWFYPTGNNGYRFDSNPLIADGVMYVIGKNNDIVALDAATGRDIWVHQNGSPSEPASITHRGLNYWQSKDGKQGRILYAIDNMLHAIDAHTGKLIESFGENGSVDLRVGLGRDPKTIRFIQSGTPGRVFENLLILGSATGEGYGSPPGDLRAYSVLTGKLVWTFHTIPHPGEFGYDTWPKNAWKSAGGTNTWGGISIDEKRGIAYFPLGSATYDFYGADRIGADLFSNCLLALDARTGKYLWHYQAVHHDLWDYDLATSPKLLTIEHDGKMVDVVAEAGKNGFLYVLNRVTGKPIWPIVERPVPKSTMPGEQAWPTQPYPTAPPPFARQSFTADDVDPYIADPAERAKLRQEILDSNNLGLFTPPATINTMEMPGNNGGSNWGTGAADPTTSMMYVVSKDAPSMIKLEAKPPKRPLFGSPATQGQILYIQNCQLCHGAELKGQPPGIPSLVGIVPRVGAERIRTAVTKGVSPMPAFPDLEPKDVNSLIAYLTDPSAAHIPARLLAFLKAPPPATPTDKNGKPTRYWTGYGYMNSSEGLPAIKPPWSTLTAYDLNQGIIKWQIPYGGVPQMMAKGIYDTGSYWPRGGVAVTAGGLIFAPTKSDYTFRAYDKDTGKELWKTELPATPEGIPAVYEVDGREYVVMSASTESAPSALDEEQAARAAAAAAPVKKPEAHGEAQGYYVFALPAANAADRH
jgi:quinoprotein glucose dehydrogenase